MKKSLLKELTAEQRAKLKEMTGDAFKAEANDWREQFQQRVRGGRRGANQSSDSDSSSDSDRSSSRSSSRTIRRSGGGR